MSHQFDTDRFETMNAIRSITKNNTLFNRNLSICRNRTRSAFTIVRNSKLPAPDLRKLADLARIEISDEEVNEWQPKVNGIVEWFDQLQSIDLSDIAPQLRAGVPANRLRKDIPKSFDKIPDLIAQAPDKDGDFVRVPKMN